MLLSSCARAASAAETRYRINAPIAPARAALVVALDEAAVGVARRAAAQEWASARFFVCNAAPPADADGNGSPDAVLLLGIDGSPTTLNDELSDTDVVVMIATEDAGAQCAYSVGKACWERAIMTAGIVLGDAYEAEAAVAALRPHARVLLPSADEDDLTELLTALRA